MPKNKKSNPKIKKNTPNKIKKNIVFDGSCYDYLMRNNNFSCGFNMPNALEGKGNYGLPPYSKRMPFLVDKYPSCPENWLRSEGKIKSYFVPVTEGKGMWLDFNENTNHSHHVAVVISVQGINPITGMPCEDAQMEQYIEECPKHKIKFGTDRYCKKCDYKWPKQNYICTTGTPDGYFWLDGFRTIDGLVRQYILTSEKMKGVASNIIGKDRVYAVGLSFFTSKEKRPPKTQTYLSGTWTNWNSPPYSKIDYVPNLETIITCDTNNQYLYKGTTTETNSVNYIVASSLSNTKSSNLKKRTKSIDRAITQNQLEDETLRNTQPITELPLKKAKRISTKKLEVGAGANINQAIYDDPETMDYWRDTSESIICINYCTEEDAKKIIEAGEISLDGHKEGYLKNIPIGN